MRNLRWWLLVGLAAGVARAGEPLEVEWKNGLRLRSTDGAFEIRPRVFVQVDAAGFRDDDDVNAALAAEAEEGEDPDAFQGGAEVRRARTGFEGTLYGAVSGYVGGRTDQIMMRIVDILLAIPFMFVIILLLVMFGRSIFMLFLGIGLLSWLNMARIVRGQTLSLKHKEYVEAAQATGVPTFTIILRHIVPNLLGIVAVYATLLVPEMILTESFISFLGLGVQEPLTSLGALISEGARTIYYGTIWQLLWPLTFFVLTLFSFFFVGDGLRDALDPKDR